MPLRAQPQRQIMLAYEQLDVKVGELFEEAFAGLQALIEGHEVDPRRLGVAYEGPADWRVDDDRRISSVIERLRVPYEQALAQLEAEVGQAAESGQLAEVITLHTFFTDRVVSQKARLAAASADMWTRVQLRDDPNREEARFAAWIEVDAIDDLLRLTVEKLELELRLALKVVIRFHNGEQVEAVLDAYQREVAVPAGGHTIDEVADALLRVPH
jgi:hypothetical protein